MQMGISWGTGSGSSTTDIGIDFHMRKHERAAGDNMERGGLRVDMDGCKQIWRLRVVNEQDDRRQLY